MKFFKEIKTSFCFLDETGLIYSKTDQFFAIGIIECPKPQNLYNKIRKIRDQYRYNEEVKWTRLNRKIRFDVARNFFEVFLLEDAKFNCIILNKEELDFEKYFQNDLYKVYQNFTIALLKIILGKKPNEVLILLMDNYFTPDGTDLEVKIKRFINDHYKNFIIAGVCQIDSKSSDILQLTDLILGAILYDLKKQNNLIEPTKSSRFKRRFLNYLYQKLKIKKSFFINKSGVKTRNYVLFGDKIRATIFDCKRSTTQKKQAMTHNG